jgi:hypothetical protein
MAESVAVRRFQHIQRILLPPLSPAMLAVNFAVMSLDRSAPLLDRYYFASTAVRLAIAYTTAINIPAVKRSGLCERLAEVFGDETICENLPDKVIRIVNELERGLKPISEEVVLTLAQLVVVAVAENITVVADRIVHRVVESLTTGEI